MFCVLGTYRNAILSLSMQRIKNAKRPVIFIIGLLLGATLIAGLHYIQFAGDGVHHHANFAVYVDGERQEFDNFTFYEEIQACSPGDELQPSSRAHMHEMVNSVVHVHDEGVTWGHFFANLGYSLSDEALETRDAVYIDDEGGELRFILNGQATNVVANQLIGDGDKLLIDYSSDATSQLQARFDDIPGDAESYNQTEDPGSCSGSGQLPFGQRVLRAVGVY